MYSNNTSKGGASNWPVVMMVKCMMLQKWFNLSDPMLEKMLLDRISFRRFVGLTMDDKTPDETVFVVFRRRLREHGHCATLFDKTVEILKQRGLILEEGICVDATILEASRGHKRPDGSSTKDPSASYTKKHGRNYHGFKAHIATDTHGIIKDCRFDTAKVHDSQHIDDLIVHETHSATPTVPIWMPNAKRTWHRRTTCSWTEGTGRWTEVAQPFGGGFSGGRRTPLCLDEEHRLSPCPLSWPLS